MASYTMQLREYIESFSYPNQDTMKRSDVIEAGRTQLFDFNYPILADWKTEFETNFIKNFYMREIGFETEGLFKLALENWLNLNMDYWNNMYNSTLLSYNPLQNVVMDKTYHKTNDKTQNDTNDVSLNGTNSSNGSTTNSETNNLTSTEDNFNRRISSNNPDTRLALTATDGEGVIEYASEIEENNENNSNTKNGTSSGNTTNTNSGTTNATQNTTLSSTIDDTEDYTEHYDGKTGDKSFPKLIQEHRDIFLRIDKMIFKEMNELFMLVY